MSPWPLSRAKDTKDWLRQNEKRYLGRIRPSERARIEFESINKWKSSAMMDAEATVFEVMIWSLSGVLCGFIDELRCTTKVIDDTEMLLVGVGCVARYQVRIGNQQSIRHWRMFSTKRITMYNLATSCGLWEGTLYASLVAQSQW